MKNNLYKNMPYIDVLSEPSINMIRIYLIIRELQVNRNNRLVLTLEKLCFFYSVIVSDDMVNTIINRSKNKDDNVFYDSEDESLSYKNSSDIKDAIEGNKIKDYIINMCSLDLITIEIIKNDKLLSINKAITINENDPLILKWIENIKKIKFCINKSERELYLSLIEACHV